MNVEINFEVTKNAIEQFKKAKKDAGLDECYILVNANSGCSGLNFTLDFLKKEEIKENYIIENYEGVDFVFEKRTSFLMDGVNIDWHEEAETKGFKFTNSNPLNEVKKSCCSKKSCC